jgi:translation initiation factor 6 (eIF-6)
MQVHRRSARKKVGVLEKKEIAACIVRGDLERDVAETKRSVLAVNILACRTTRASLIGKSAVCAPGMKG